ncbi:hypothetical protein BD560DRAFT_455975 [Blakeslea trispora]|nr:hypothetical protein BD560DRAFT_455975 [Blakeslea trispora]
MESHALASISLTHVYFNPTDKLSYLLAYITLAPIAILVFYASVIVSRREVAGILMLMGQLLNEGLNYLLKEHIAQDRPHDHLGDGYGMPSSHAQFICVYLGYHTKHQVIAGSFVGILFGVIWYRICQWLHSSGLVKTMLSTCLARKLYLRDMSFVQNVARWEYEQWCQLQEETRPKQI